MMRRASAVLPQRVGASLMLAKQARAAVPCLWCRREAASFAFAPCDHDAAAMEMLTSSTAGRGFFATRHIRAGERILTEAPIVSDNLTQLAHVRVCVRAYVFSTRNTYIRMCICTCLCMCPHTCTCVCDIHVYVYVYVYVYVCVWV